MGRIAPQLTPAAHKQPASAMEHVTVSAIRIADRAVISDIESAGHRVGPLGNRLYDVRPMLDEREQPAESIDMFSQALAYALARGLVEQAHQPWLVRIVARV
jgi:hypothetical protein